MHASDRPGLDHADCRPESAGWWGVWIIMLGDATAFISLVFGFFFYWTTRSDFPPAGSQRLTPSTQEPAPSVLRFETVQRQS
ncbi:hypothetical protein IMCC3135_02440 [Granulosicoccus antarcticus IMCC3135]|uniref:Uncharacterized protein n=1 Tax=Granulosicoccus antarcticus IMCC3135 TaxID=1192854 RepID=A0A2Z2NKR7_9GAMM|nr:hypothetical protein IMCC3135_02440 [Granulosicoccus antarcticus IMCC3135]